MSVLNDILSCKKPLPVLSYPGAALAGIKICDAVKSGELQARIVLEIANRFDSAAAVMPMDLSVEAECFGCDITFPDSGVPEITGTVAADADGVESLAVPTVGSCRSGEFIKGVGLTKNLVTDRPLLAGIAGPFSLAARLAGVSDLMLLCFDEPEATALLLEKCTAFLADYAAALKAAGADGLIIAEPVAGLLSPAMEAEFSAPYVSRLAREAGSDGFLTIYHNCGESVNNMAASVFANGCAAFHFGNAVDLKKMLEQAPADCAVMGNLDPVALFKNASPDEMRAAVMAALDDFGSYGNFVLSSGCDIPFDASPANIEAFFSASEEYRRN